MKKRMKKAHTEYRQVVNDIADALVVLKEVDDAVNVWREELKELVEHIGVTKKLDTSSVIGSGKYEEETYITHKLRDIERDYKELVRKHNCLAEVVGELNMISHTHWCK